ncbi:MAG TPA: hypothetical protein VGK31_01525 [Thermoanaerobaculia bacterium]
MSGAALAIAMTSIAGADELAITSGGRRIIDRDPTTAVSNCYGWTYGPSPLIDDAGDLVAMYTVSDAATNHCKVGIESEQRFGDSIQLNRLTEDGTWSAGINVIDRSNLPWMNDPSFLAEHPETFVGHVASPSVVRIDGRYYMVFVGSVDDRNLCAGEHPMSANICGSCRDPWSYFVAMWAASDDGEHWRVRERVPGDAILIGRAPAPNDRAIGSNYKGITHVAMVTHEEKGRTYFYIGAQYWSPSNIKSLMFRIRYDGESEWGIIGEPEMWSWNRKYWLLCPSGIVPDLINQYNEHSLLISYDPLSSISTTTRRGFHEYIALASRSNRISYQFSTNLVDWTPNQTMRSALPYFADGYSYDASVIDPVMADDRLFFASADGDEAFGIARDGRHDCGSNSDYGATAPYVGTGIYESHVELISPRATRTRVTVDHTSIVSGDVIRCSAEVTDERGSPVEGVVLIRGDGVMQVRLIDGHAEAIMPMRGLGTHYVDAWFEDQGMWQASKSDFVTITIVPNNRRRAARR